YQNALFILSPPFYVFFTHPATTAIYTLSLHDALPISCGRPDRCSAAYVRPLRCASGSRRGRRSGAANARTAWRARMPGASLRGRSEEHTSELQSLRHLVCRLLLEKKNSRGHVTMQ